MDISKKKKTNRGDRMTTRELLLKIQKVVPLLMSISLSLEILTGNMIFSYIIKFFAIYSGLCLFYHIIWAYTNDKEDR